MATDHDNWATLGLEPPGDGIAHDARAIRKAYARSLKSIDPSADPAGFQRLRQSYERALELAATPPDEGTWRRFAADIGTSPSEIAQIDEAIRQQGTALHPESQIALNALCDMERVAVLDQAADSADACHVLNQLLKRSGADALTEETLQAIEFEADAVWDKPLGIIETPVEYVAARLSVIADRQSLALLAIHDEGENRLFAIATRNAAVAWAGNKLAPHIHVAGVAHLPEDLAGDRRQSTPRHNYTTEAADETPEMAGLFASERPTPTAEADEHYADYVRWLDVAMTEGSDENDWFGLFDQLDEETPELRDEVELLIFRTLLATQRSTSDAERLPASFTAGVVEALDEQFQWLSDGVGFQRKFEQNSDVMVVALNTVRGRQTRFSKVLLQPNFLVVSLFCVVAYALMRALFDWLTTLGVIS